MRHPWSAALFTDGAAQEGLDLPNDAIEIEHFEVPHLSPGERQ